MDTFWKTPCITFEHSSYTPLLTLHLPLQTPVATTTGQVVPSLVLFCQTSSDICWLFRSLNMAVSVVSCSANRWHQCTVWTCCSTMWYILLTGQGKLGTRMQRNWKQEHNAGKLKISCSSLPCFITEESCCVAYRWKWWFLNGECYPHINFILLLTRQIL